MDVEKLDCKISCLTPLQKGCIANVFWLGYESPSFSQSHHLPVTVFAVPMFCFCLSNLSWAVAASVVQRRDLGRVGVHSLSWRWSCGGTLRNTELFNFIWLEKQRLLHRNLTAEFWVKHFLSRLLKRQTCTFKPDEVSLFKMISLKHFQLLPPTLKEKFKRILLPFHSL